MKSDLKSKKGFTLIEIIVAVSLLVLVVGFFISMFQSGINLSINSKARIDALMEAQSLLEDIKAHRVDWDNKIQLIEWLVMEKGYSEVSDGYLERSDRRVRIELTEISSSLVDIKTTIHYRDKTQINKTLELRTRYRYAY